MTPQALLEAVRDHLAAHTGTLDEGALRLSLEGDAVRLTCTRPVESGHGARDIARVRETAAGYEVDWEGDPALMPVADNTAGEEARYPTREALLDTLVAAVGAACRSS